jgi:hypothetical protein
MTKAIIAEGNQLRYSPNWIFAKRARLKIFEDHLECGDWKIDYSEIQEAVLHSTYTTFIIPGYVLMIRTKNKTYHFGINWGRFWSGDLPFKVMKVNTKMTYSAPSIILRIAILAYLAYFIWKTFLRK